MKKSSFLILLILTWFSLSAPAEVYRYRDSSGNWHYSDVKPGDGGNDSPKIVKLEEIKLGEIPSQTGQSSSKPTGRIAVAVPDDLCPSDSKRRSIFFQVRKGILGTKGTAKIEQDEQQDQHKLVATNKFFAPLSVKVWLETSSGLKTEPNLPTVIEVPPHTSKTIVTFSQKQKGEAWYYRYRTTSRLGKLNAKHDPDCYYLSPVPAGKTFTVTQGFNGSFSHTNDYNKYAVDIGMPIGTPIVAARDGIVISREEKFTLGGLTEKFARRGNRVRILHGDGTIGSYVHLRFASIRVYEGEEVRAGQVIGLSGNTGYSSGPHLHFVVMANRDMELKSIPFQFYVDGQPQTPGPGDLLTNLPNN